MNAAAGATMDRELIVRGNGRLGVGGGGADVARDDSVVPPGPRGRERRAPIFAVDLGVGDVQKTTPEM